MPLQGESYKQTNNTDIKNEAPKFQRFFYLRCELSFVTLQANCMKAMA